MTDAPEQPVGHTAGTLFCSGVPTHVRVNLAGWRDRSVISTSVRIGTNPNALIDVLERVDIQSAWGVPEPIVSVDGNGSGAKLLKVKAAWIAMRILRATLLLPLTVLNVVSIKRHWSAQRAAITKATS